MSNLPQSRKSNIVVQEFETEVLIYDLTINKAFCLNPTSTLIWQLCDGTNSISQISEIISRKLKTPFSDDLIWLALDQFKGDNLLEQNDELWIEFGGLNRRQVIKKVGFTSMVMLPIISSIIAPTSAMAQSGGLALLAACSSSSQCQSQHCASVSNFGNACCLGNGPYSNAPGAYFAVALNLAQCNQFAASLCCNGATQPGGPGSQCLCA